MAKFSKEKEEEIIQLYNSGKSPQEISKVFNTFNTSIRRVLLRNSITPPSPSERNRKLIPTFFNDYNSPDIQYWLGVLASDGCIMENRLVLEAKDLDWIEDFRLYLNPNINIITTQPKKGNTLYRVSLRIKGIHNELEKYGLVPNKSLTLVWKYPITSDFLRGYFDGDGTVVIAKQARYPIVSICSGSEIILKQIKDFLKENNIESHIREEKKDRKNTLFVLKINKYKEKIKLYHLLYENANFYLKRKEIRFKTILTIPYIKNKNRNKNFITNK